MKHGFPKAVTDLPEADIEFKGVRGWIAQGEGHQIVFFEIESLAEVSEHSHNSPQWGIVVEGKMELTIEDKTGVYKKGDEYFIPTRAKHSAKFLSKCRVLDFFVEKMRYKPSAPKRPQYVIEELNGSCLSGQTKHYSFHKSYQVAVGQRLGISEKH